MYGRDHKIQTLEQIAMFDRCSPTEIRTIASTGDLVTVAAGDVIRRSDRDDSFVLVVSGEAEAPGRRLEAGDSYGARGLLTDVTDAGQVRMITPGRVFVVSGRQFASLSRRLPGFTLGIARDIARGRAFSARRS